MDANTGPVTGRRRDLLGLLRAAPVPMTVRDLADRMRVHPNTVRFHLDALVRSGHVERIGQAGTGPGRPPLTFRVRRGMDPAGPRGYRLLASILADCLSGIPSGIDQASLVGRGWGQRLIGDRAFTSTVTDDEAVAMLTDLLTDIGFGPEASDADQEIRLRHCPFLELTRIETRLICQVHLGLMQGALAALGASITVDRLSPFVEPDLCLAHLTHIGDEKTAGSALKADPGSGATPFFDAFMLYFSKS